MTDSTKQGWVRLHRKICQNDLWFSESFTKAHAWIDLFLNANHKEGSFWIRGNEIKLKRGQIGWSELTMSSRWRWSKNKTRRYLKWLETEQQIVQHKSSKTTIITILNYEAYQSDEKTEQQTIQQKDSRRYTNKNDKNDKNDKNIEEREEQPPKEKSRDFFRRGESYKKTLEWLQNKGVPTESVGKELDKFISYWTELNSMGNKQRWEMEKTFEVQKRLAFWLSRVNQFTSKPKGKGLIQ